mmetsp:Transcript_28023/g.47104  ORF Transcript_28023/g.47104 Transcript_28023/m.47104 type:complete len:96 (+) Transcript_28023:1917-2204(+)
MTPQPQNIENSHSVNANHHTNLKKEKEKRRWATEASDRIGSHDRNDASISVEEPVVVASGMFLLLILCVCRRILYFCNRNSPAILRPTGTIITTL